MSHSPLAALLLVLSFVSQAPDTSRALSPRWVVLFRNADYRVSLDTAHVDRRRDGTYLVRYETWHLHGESDQGLRFNREEVRSELRCTPLGFRTREVALFLDQGPALRREPGDGVAPGSLWKAPGVNSVDLPVTRAACRLLSPQPSAARPSHRISFVTVAPGARLEVLDWGGTGPPMVFLAGFGNTAHVFDGFAPQFTSAWHVVGITRGGFGASARTRDGYDSATLTHDILAALDSLGVRQATFVAHSFGGSELNYLGAFHADRVSRLIYIDASYDFARLYADSIWQRAFPIPRPEGPRTSARGELRRWFGLVMGPALPDDEIDVLTSAGATAGLDTTLQHGAAAVDLRRITPPVLAIWATPRSAADQYPYLPSLTAVDRARLTESFAMQQSVRARHMDAFRNQVPNARIVPIPGGRHYLFLSHPQDVARAMREWLAK